MTRAMEEEAELGRRIRAARAYVGLSQGELAERLGLHRQTLGRYEAGVGLPTSGPRRASLIEGLAKATDLEADFFTAELAR